MDKRLSAISRSAMNTVGRNLRRDKCLGHQSLSYAGPYTAETVVIKYSNNHTSGLFINAPFILVINLLSFLKFNLHGYELGNLNSIGRKLRSSCFLLMIPNFTPSRTLQASTQRTQLHNKVCEKK